MIRLTVLPSTIGREGGLALNFLADIDIDNPGHIPAAMFLRADGPLFWVTACKTRNLDGVVAQLVERLVRNQEFTPSLSDTYEDFA